MYVLLFAIFFCLEANTSILLNCTGDIPTFGFNQRLNQKYQSFEIDGDKFPVVALGTASKSPLVLIYLGGDTVRATVARKSALQVQINNEKDQMLSISIGSAKGGMKTQLTCLIDDSIRRLGSL